MAHGDRAHTVDGVEVEHRHTRETPHDPVRVVPQKTYFFSVFGAAIGAAGLLSGPLLFMNDARIDQRVERHNRDDQAHSQPTASMRAHISASQTAEVDRRMLTERLDRIEARFQAMSEELTRLRTLLEERTKGR
jgi:hypothetical protein